MGPDHERGIAVIVAMMGILIISALGTALVLGTATETMIARNFRAAVGAAAAADLSLRIAIEELASLGDWNAVLTGSVRSRFADGLPDGDRMLAGHSTINPAVLSNLATCGKAAPCSTSEMTAITAERPWGANNPRWRPFLYGAVADMSAAASGSPFYAVVLVADDPAEIDADPLADSLVPGPGAGVILVRATAFGPGGARATLEATIVRRDPIDLSLFPDAPPVRMLSWRMSR